MVNVNGQKMSKSLEKLYYHKRFIRFRDKSDDLKIFCLTVNYRKPLDFTDEALRSASEAWKNINMALSFFDITKIENLSIEINKKNEFVEEKYKETINF